MKKLLLISAFLVLGMSSAAVAQTVYSSAKGEKYHTADCKYSGDASEISVGDAKKANKKPCDICKPDELGKAKLVQCSGKTKDSARCKRMTAAKGGKCFQHQSK